MQVGDGLYIRLIDPRQLREQDVNAQVMQPVHFEKLTENVRARGQLESLPYCWQPDPESPIEIVSGHHRVRAAVAAGIDRIPILLDTLPMRRSLLVAKQIAHNELSGEQDLAVLQTLLTMIDDIDDYLVTGLPDDLLPVAPSDDTSLHVPAANFDWRTASFVFLPADLAEFTSLLDALDRNTDLIAVAQREQFDEFSRAVVNYGHTRNIRNFSVALLEVTRTAVREMERIEAEREAEADAEMAVQK